MTDSMIGGDLPGLNTMVTTLAAAPEEMSGVVQALNADVEGLVGATGWSGGAADNFRSAWTADAMAGGLLSELVSGVAETLSTLVQTLEILEQAMREAAGTARAAGVPVGPTGAVSPFVAPAPPDGSTAPTIAASVIYTKEAAALREQARLARLAAERDLAAMLDSLLEKPMGATPDLYVTAADYLRALLAVPNEANRQFLATYKERMAALQDARRAAKADLADARAAGADIRPGDPGYAPYRKAINEIKDLDQKTSAARAADGGPAWSKVLNSKLEDVTIPEGLAKELHTPQSLDFAKLPKFLQFTKEIPVLDVVATGAAAALQTKDDIEKGWSPTHSIAADVGAGALGLGVGIALASTAPVSVPVGLVAVVAGGVAMGVGDYAYQAFHEHWKEDIHDHGVAGGILTGAGHSGERVGEDAKNIFLDAKNGGEKLWRKMF